MSLVMNEEFYYNNQKLLSYDCLFNFVLGERGNGKTFSFKRLCIARFIKYGEEFIWLRRYETELDDIDLFFTDMVNLFKKHEFKVSGGKFYCDNKIMGYYLPLSKAITKKSTPYPNVKRICYDECLVKKSSYRYLPNEVEALLDFYETVARSRDVYLYCIANAISEINPYFIYFNIKLTGQQFIKVQPDVMLEVTDCQNYRQAKKQTRFAKIIDGTKYSRYAIDNEFVNDNKEFIEQKTEGSINRFNIKINDRLIGIWYDTKEGKIYCSFKSNPQLPTYCITTDELKPNYLILKANSNYMKNLKNAFEYGYIYFESMKIKGYMEEVKKFLYIK